MCCRSASTKPILPRNETKTATPPNGVTARCVSRRINRSSDNRAVISRGTGLSVAFDSIPLLSQILGPKIILNFVFRFNFGIQDKVTDWRIPALLYQIEKYNGFGYRTRRPGVLSPYLWSASRHYMSGKFVADGTFDPAVRSRQPSPASA